jgi:hypothetical protein
MKRITAFGMTALLSLLTVSCGGTTAITYKTTFSVQDPVQRSQLLLMTQHVIERRLQGMGEEGAITNIMPTTEGADVTVEIGDKIIGDVLTSQLTEPFTLEVMKEVPADKADITVAGHGSFAKTGIGSTHLIWVNAAPQPDGTMAMVTMIFTPEGRSLMQKLFKENKGKFVGIFVRGRLVSKLNVQTDELKDDIVIQDIPSFDLAQVFADDVNVGMHVAFVPAP